MRPHSVARKYQADDIVYRYRNVSYTYPGNHTPALKDVSLVLEAGETLAIVGYNGSGECFLIE